MLIGDEGLSYRKRLWRLELKYRTMNYVLLEVYKIMRVIVRVNAQSFLLRVGESGTRRLGVIESLSYSVETGL